MKTFKYFAGVLALSAALTACGDGKKSTTGNTQDTTAKTDTTSLTTAPTDTSKADSGKTTAPANNTAVDTSDARPVH
ncbi:hypothetical protein D0C36_10280 [Mucilaginibacter conchicola]|uniref:Coproporphyrinogen III oxidase n=1 Tax=Mucilaginibacter conchicola TaxID=2303333 RepID=A0A372NT36_9SPHI|nr:hypothetical protein [Mucilaginibacter conchicola]RFZ91829.1 hypothetical protein D0C36_10280 [Mucilaginibacter conchicola]